MQMAQQIFKMESYTHGNVKLWFCLQTWEDTLPSHGNDKIWFCLQTWEDTLPTYSSKHLETLPISLPFSIEFWAPEIWANFEPWAHTIHATMIHSIWISYVKVRKNPSQSMQQWCNWTIKDLLQIQSYYPENHIKSSLPFQSYYLACQLQFYFIEIQLRLGRIESKEIQFLNWAGSAKWDHVQLVWTKPVFDVNLHFR